MEGKTNFPELEEKVESYEADREFHEFSFDLICGLCRKPYSDPLLLPCLHSFCRKCLEERFTELRKEAQTPMSSSTSLPVPCICCQTLFTGEISDLFFNRCLARKSSASTNFAAFSGNGLDCDCCGGITSATKFCSECGEALCEECSKFHQRSLKLKSHELVPIDSSHSKQLKTAIASHEASVPAHCLAHPNKAIQLFCKGCSKLVCDVCIAHSHHGDKCKFSLIEEAIKDSMKEINASLDALVQPHDQLKLALAKGKVMAMMIGVRENEVKDQICSAFDELIAAIVRRKKILLVECMGIAEGKRARLSLQMEQLRDLKDQIQHSQKFVLEAKRSCSEIEMIEVSETISAQLHKLNKMYSSKTLTPCPREGIIGLFNTAAIVSQIQQLGILAEGSHPPHCRIEVQLSKGYISCTVGIKKTLRLVAIDDQRKRVSHGGEAVEASIHGNTDDTVQVKDMEDGTYQLSLLFHSPGEWQLLVTIGEHHVLESPCTVKATKMSPDVSDGGQKDGSLSSESSRYVQVSRRLVARPVAMRLSKRIAPAI